MKTVFKALRFGLLVGLLGVGLLPASSYALGYSTATKAAIVNAIAGQVGNTGVLVFYSGTQPATCGTETTRLVTFTLRSPFAPTTSTATLNITVPAVATVTTAGTATWFRVSTNTGTCVFDGTLGISGADINLVSTTFFAGLSVGLSSWSITSGN